jgi:hypothetical protein
MDPFYWRYGLNIAYRDFTHHTSKKQLTPCRPSDKVHACVHLYFVTRWMFETEMWCIMVIQLNNTNPGFCSDFIGGDDIALHIVTRHGGTIILYWHTRCLPPAYKYMYLVSRWIFPTKLVCIIVIQLNNTISTFYILLWGDGNTTTCS